VPHVGENTSVFTGNLETSVPYIGQAYVRSPYNASRNAAWRLYVDQCLLCSTSYRFKTKSKCTFNVHWLCNR